MIEVRNYDKAELAMLYFPKATEKAALARLSRWIKRIPALFAAIYGPQQRKRLHYFTRHQVELIFEYLDEP